MSQVPLFLGFVPILIDFESCASLVKFRYGTMDMVCSGSMCTCEKC